MNGLYLWYETYSLKEDRYMKHDCLGGRLTLEKTLKGHKDIKRKQRKESSEEKIKKAREKEVQNVTTAKEHHDKNLSCFPRQPL